MERSEYRPRPGPGRVGVSAPGSNLGARAQQARSAPSHRRLPGISLHGGIAVALGIFLVGCSGHAAASSSRAVSPAGADRQAVVSAGRIEHKVKDIVATLLEVAIEQVRPEASFAGDLGADSLFVTEVVLALEQEFQFTLPEDEAAQIKTVGDAIRCVERHVQ